MNRRNALKSAAALSAVAGGSIRGACAQSSPPPAGTRLLFRGATVLTLERGARPAKLDVLVEGDKIAAIEPRITAGDAQTIDASAHLLAPGFIETHRHTWQSCLRHLGANWSAAQYFAHNFFKFGVVFRPEDVYAANLIGRLAALDGGITTLLDWSHIMNSPAHADAAVQALRDSGGRSVFAMGWPQAPNPAIWIAKSTADLPDDIRRVRREHFSDNRGGLVTLAIAARGPDFAVIEQVARDLRIARELDLRTTVHVGFASPGGIKSMGAARLLGPDITHVHVQNCTLEELKLIEDSGGTVSISPLDEMLRIRWRRAMPPIIRTIERGFPVSLSCDSESTSAGDMFSIMRSTLAVGRVEAANPPDDRPEPKDFSAANGISTRRVLEMATIDGARCLGAERSIGTLAVGKQADLLMLQANHLAYYPMHDPIDALVGAADTSSIDAVFVNGQVRKWNGRMVDTDLVGRARRLADASRDYLFGKTGFKPPQS